MTEKNFLNYEMTSETETTSTYVTPEMCGAVGDGVTDDTTAMQAAFNTGKDVVFLSDYYITDQITISSKSNIKVYGNNHTVHVASKAPVDNVHNVVRYAFYLYDCSNVSFEDLSITSDVDQNMIGISLNETTQYPEIFTSGIKSSNVQGIRVYLSENISIKNYSSHNLYTDISFQRCENINVNNWFAENCLTGIYTSATKNISISDFKIVCDPDNTIEYSHAFYFCYDTENLHISNGEAVHKNVYENVACEKDGVATTVTAITPLFTVHGGEGTEERPRQKQIFVDNVKFTAQRIINVSSTEDIPVFSRCTFTGYYPETETMPATAYSRGYLTLTKSVSFYDCVFNLNDMNIGFATDVADIEILLDNCVFNCVHEYFEGYKLKAFLLGYNGNYKLTNCHISWPGYVRKLTTDSGTEFYNCIIEMTSSGSSVVVFGAKELSHNTSFINSFVNSGHYIHWFNLTDASNLNIIGCNLISGNTVWYGGTKPTTAGTAKLYDSYHNDTKITM